MSNENLTAVGLRQQFYRDSYRRVIVVLLLSVIINLILGGVLFYLVTNTPKPKYFATSIEGRITPLTALDLPSQTDSAVLQWASQAATAAFSYNFVNYRKELQSASDYFTPAGWKEFMRALESSNNLEAVKEKKLVVSAVVAQAPVVLQKGVLKGRYAWRIQMPILVTYQSASEFSQQNNVVTLLVTRVSTLNSPHGIGIEQFIVAPSGSLA
ncbi:MAG: type IVB secretion system apparatus protein IcmL/DotI [Gammaproteobacteria bacterium]